MAIAAVAFVAQQSKPWEKIPIPPLHDFKPQQPKRIELKNGIVLFLQEDHELPFVSGSVLIPGGARDEDPAKMGLVDLYGETWRTSGTRKDERRCHGRSARVEGRAHRDRRRTSIPLALSWDSLKGDSDQVFALAMDLLLHPKFNPQKAAAGAAAGGDRHRAPQR